MNKLTRVLCPVDFSDCSARALAYAMRLAVRGGSQLRVLHVMPPLPPSTVSLLGAEHRQRSLDNLRALVDQCRLPGVNVESVLIESAERDSRIFECAEAFDADLIVMGSHGRSGAQRVLLGSVVEALLHRSARPILIVPLGMKTQSTDDAVVSRMICAMDFQPASFTALALALSIAEEHHAQLTLLHVIDTPPELSHAPEPLDRYVAPLRAQARASALQQLQQLIPVHTAEHCSVETAVVEGGVARQVLQAAERCHADLIVMGVHGRNAFDLAFFGSNSKDVIRHATSAVLIVPASRRADSTRRDPPARDGAA